VNYRLTEFVACVGIQSGFEEERSDLQLVGGTDGFRESDSIAGYLVLLFETLEGGTILVRYNVHKRSYFS